MSKIIHCEQIMESDKLMNHEDIKNKTPRVQKFCTLFAFAFAVSTIFARMMALDNFLIISFALPFAWLVFAFIGNPKFFLNLKKHELLTIFFILYTVIVPYILSNAQIGNRYLAFGQVLIFYFIYLYNHKYKYYASSKFIIIWSMPFVIYTNITSLIALNANYWAVKIIKTQGEYTDLARSQGIGGYEFIYFLVFLCIILIFFISQRKTLKLKISVIVFALTLLLLLSYTIILSQFFTALIMLTVSILIMFIFAKRQASINILYFGVAMVSIISFKPIFMALTNFLIYLNGTGRTVQRLEDLQQQFSGSDRGDGFALSERTFTLDMSLDGIYNHPVCGIIVDPIASDDGFLIGFGQHSHFLDTFALFGVFIGALLVYIIVQPFLRKKHSALKGFNLAILASTLILFTMNNVTPSIGFAIFFIYPVFCDWFEKKIEQQKEPQP